MKRVRRPPLLGRLPPTQYQDGRGVAYGGHMAAALALMEWPAIIMAVILANALRRPQAAPAVASFGGAAAIAVPGGPPGARACRSPRSCTSPSPTARSCCCSARWRSACASYIAVPAVLRYAIPEASPSLYFGMSLGVTIPLNILIGIPLYTSLAATVLG